MFEPGNEATRREKARREEAADLDAEILSAIGGGWDDPLEEAEFDFLARRIFAHQLRFNEVYRRFCAARDVSASADVRSWREIPAIPAGAFKVGRWATFPPEAEAAAFRTSGTTQGTPGIHRFDTLGLYNAAIVPAARRFLLPDRERIRCLLLSPPPAAEPHSSLVHMFAVYREAFGDVGSGFLPPERGAGGGGGDGRGPGEAPERGAATAAAAFDRAEADGAPVLVAGAALAFHRVLEATDWRWRLPEGSRAMVTGGFKGVREAADPDALAAAIEARLGIERAMQAGEYGMTELSSQSYTTDVREAVLDEPGAAGFVPPPWTRVRVVEPLTGDDLPRGEVGALVHVDLANRASAVVVQTSDLGRIESDGSLTLAGRSPGAEARGCSLAADAWYGGP